MRAEIYGNGRETPQTSSRGRATHPSVRPAGAAPLERVEAVPGVDDPAGGDQLAQQDGVGVAELGPLGAASRTIVERDFVWTRLVDKHIELYEELVASTSRQGSRGDGGR
jgi:S1-C subfamily serine protease